MKNIKKMAIVILVIAAIACGIGPVGHTNDEAKFYEKITEYAQYNYRFEDVDEISVKDIEFTETKSMKNAVKYTVYFDGELAKMCVTDLDHIESIVKNIQE